MLQRSFFTRLFTRKPKQAVLPLKTAENTAVHPHFLFGVPLPAKPKECRKRFAYIPTNESPWIVLYMAHGCWRIALYQLHDTRAEARNKARLYANEHFCPTRVVRAIIPTR